MLFLEGLRLKKMKKIDVYMIKRVKAGGFWMNE